MVWSTHNTTHMRRESEWHSVAEGSLSSLTLVLTARSSDWRVIAACQLANFLMLLLRFAPKSHDELRRCWSHTPPRSSPP